MQSAKAISMKPWIGIRAMAAKERARMMPATLIARPARMPATRIAGRSSRSSASRQMRLIRKTL